MAKLSDKIKSLIIADYLTGSYSQRKLANKHGVSIGTISKLTKDLETSNEHLVNAQKSLIIADSKLPNEQMNAIMNTAHDEVRRYNLISSASEMVIQKVVDLVEKGKSQKVITVGQGMGITSPEIVECDLQAKDYKDIQDTIDKASITLGVNERFSTQKVEVNNQNNQQTIIEVEIE